MMNILLLQDDENIRERVAFVLESQYNAMVVQAATPEEARARAKERPSGFHLIVIDCDRSRGKEVDKFRSETSETQSIVFLHGPPDKALAVSTPPGRPVPAFVDRGDIVQNLLTTIGGMIKHAILPNPDDDRNFCKIRTRLLLSVCPLGSDIYIRLSEAKYLKLMKQGDTFDLQDMEKYTVKKGVEFLFLRRNAVGDFIKKYQAELLGYLERKPEMTLQEVAPLNDQVLETLQELGSSVGWTPEVQALAKGQVALTVKAMGKSPRLSSLFEKLESFQGKYIASHSTLCGYLSCSIASQMKWGSDTTFHKLTLASFLHDITLSNHELAECASVDECRDGPFSEEEKRGYSKHPIQAAEIAKQFSEVPPDVDSIIAQHHELPDGSGFPRGLSGAYIAPLAAIFIVAHDMARKVRSEGAGFTVGGYLEGSRDRFKQSQFRKVIQAIEQLESLG